MAVGKVTFIFGDGKYGWTETYFNNNFSGTNYSPSTPGSGLTLDNLSSIVPTSIVPLAVARTAMLPTQVAACSSLMGNMNSAPRLEWIRVSAINQPRSTYVLDPRGGDVLEGLTTRQKAAAKALAPQEAAVASFPDNPYSAIEMLCQYANGLQGKKPLSGIPDAVICDQAWNSGTGWYQNWKLFASLLTSPANGWGTYSNSPYANGVLTGAFQPILSITQNDDFGRPTIFVQNPVVFRVLQNGCPDYRVEIACYRSGPGGRGRLGGVYRVSPPIAGTAVVPGSTTPVAGYFLQLERSVRPLSPFTNGSVAPYSGGSFAAIQACTLLKPMKRDRGRPFGLHRGRGLKI